MTDGTQLYMVLWLASLYSPSSTPAVEYCSG